MFLLLYFFLFIFALLYSLVIGRASVVSSAPLAILSLLPSILISIAAWVLKSTMLSNGNGKSVDSHDENKERENEIHGNARPPSINNQLNEEATLTQNEESHSSEERNANQNGEAIGLTQNEESRSSEEREAKTATQDVEVVEVVTQNEENCDRGVEREIEVANQNGKLIAISMQLTTKEESGGREVL